MPVLASPCFEEEMKDQQPSAEDSVESYYDEDESYTDSDVVVDLY
jgi:hypothetical protein